jgi:hypothetical protein
MMPFIVSTRRKVFSEGISEKTHILFHFNLSSGKPPAGKKATIWNSYRDMGDSPGNPLIEEANLSGLDERNRRSTPLMAGCCGQQRAQTGVRQSGGACRAIFSSSIGSGL